MVDDKPIRQEVYRPAASATWEHTHKWGKQFGDSTDLRVTRTDGGSLSIRYGKESIDIRADLVQVLAEMVATAAAWVDERPPNPPAVTGEADRG